MSHRISMIAALVGVSCVCLSIMPATLGQDAQAEATAKATKRQAKEDSARSTLNIATPTDDTAPASTGPPAAAEREKLKQRAGERGDSPRGRTLILGMHVKEAADGGVEVADVGVATPAEEAGIRKGDEIVAFENFKADTYRKWIDGITRLATEAPGGSMVSILLSRDGNTVTKNVRVPENQVGPIKLPLGPPPNQIQAPAPAGDQVNNIVANGGSSNAFVGNAAIAGFFNDAAEPGAEHAVAELFRIGPSHKVSQDNTDNGNKTSANGGSSKPAGARVGFAGFRNSANGMLVMVDVGGLEPGNYAVTIADASVIGNQTQPITAPNSNNPSASGHGEPATRSAQDSDEFRPTGGIPKQNAAPLEVPAGQLPPQSNLQIPTSGIPRDILAQVSANKGSQGTSPATDGVPRNTAGPKQNLGESDTIAVRRADAVSGSNDIANRNATLAPPLQNSFGTLTVDQSGTGRMQHTVEGVLVRNVVGQALVLYPTVNGDATTLPPNLDRTAEPSPVKPKEAAETQRHSIATGSPNNADKPVVGGVIHLLSERGNSPAGKRGDQSAASSPVSPR